ncbi:cadherin-like beta sandwich domain-containing protein [Carboxylicivirga linearis]|uniref:Cadherin-like beta sandwich domain-containing protein n=1 Tax=Carboxylicivirga linearis TaxID=1628157 RepID=A0ABS5JX45_9BACT|nr:cadherin-like beta sandwich domain-containing protein [Carboxylicivirga linearis]MBS2099388.1 cadherin-like beta sandwich domain-containing protein [Carboxylicivirga linearis]
MKLKNLLLKYALLGVISFLGISMSMAQQTDTIGIFDPGLSARHIVYAEVMLHDVDEDGNFDASFNLAEDTVKAWGDYSTALAFYDEGFVVRNGGGFSKSRDIIPVAGEVTKVWIALDVPNLSCKTYVQNIDMDYPELVFDENAGFRKTDIVAINKWTTIHNPDAEPDSVEVKSIELQTSDDATLRELSASIGELTLIDAEYGEYELYVPYGTTEVTLTAATNGIGADVLIGDYDMNPYEGGVIPLTPEGADAYINVTAFDGSEATYIVYIDFEEGASNAYLSDIQLSTGSLITDFDQTVTEYTAMVPYGTTSVDVTGIKAWDDAVLTGNGTVTLTDGEGSATLTVTSQDGTATTTYTLSIYESQIRTGEDFYIEQEASGLVIGEGVHIYEALKSESTQLMQFEDAGAEGVFFIKNKDSQYMSISSSNTWNMVMLDELTQNTDSCAFIINEMEPGKFRMISVAKDAAGNNGYIATDATSAGSSLYCDKGVTNERGVWVVRTPEEVFPPDAYLLDLSIDAANIKPVFNATVTEYYVTLPEGTTSIDITAVAEEATSDIVGAGSVSVTDASGIITVTVTTADEAYTKDYVIHYIKDTALTLMHSYTFADGTAKDVVGSAHGITNGGVFAEGIFANASDSSYITFPAEEIAINTYPSITMEVYIKNVGVNNGWSMLTYFGGLTGSNTYWTSIQNDDDNIKAVIDQGSGASRAINPQEATSDASLHLVTTLTNDSISLYLNGTHIETTAINDAYYIPQLSNENAWLCYGGYNDPTWLGEIEEFNIYSGAMDELTVMAHSINWPADDVVDATLSEITIDGVPMEDFNAATLVYTVAVDEGAAIPVVGATATSGVTPVVTQATEVPGAATIVVANGGVENTYTINFEIATGIGSDINKGTIKVYPTVSTGEFTIEMEGKTSVISVYDLAGGLVKQVKTNAQREVISLDQKGMYIVKVDSDGDTKLFKVFKQ